MKKVILFMVGVLASLMLSAQSRWSVTPEAGLVVNKENEGTSVTLGFKAGAGVLYQLKEGVGKKPSFGLKSGVYILMQKGGYHPMSWKQRRNIHISTANTSKASKIQRFNFLCQCPFWFNILTAPLAISNTQLVFITTIFTSHQSSLLAFCLDNEI